ALSDHRRPHLGGERPDWKSFNALMGDDTPNPPVVALYKTLWAANEHELILVSGRGEESRELTERWLVWNEIPFNTLLMRPKGDFRPDTEIKLEILETLRKQGKSILLAVDDRQSVVDMWRANDVTCLQCAVGDF
ncbi:MAG: hypothetical protein ABJC64_12575, partial [Paracoccaceae bacterium]